MLTRGRSKNEHQRYTEVKRDTLDNVTTQKTPAAASASTGLLIILLCAMGAGPLFNYGVSVSSALIIEDLGITAGQIGFIVTVVFAAAAISSMWLGNLADKISVRAQMLLIFLGTAVALVVAAFAHSYWLLLVAAVLAGPAQAISNPTTNRVIIRAVPVDKRTGWIGVKQSGVQASQLFSGLFFPAVALALGWTGAALGGAVVCVLLWLISLKYVPSPAQLARRNNHSEAAEPPEATVDTGKVATVRTKDKLPPWSISLPALRCCPGWACKPRTSICRYLLSRNWISRWSWVGRPQQYPALSGWFHVSPGVAACRLEQNHLVC